MSFIAEVKRIWKKVIMTCFKAVILIQAYSWQNLVKLQKSIRIAGNGQDLDHVPPEC